MRSAQYKKGQDYIGVGCGAMIFDAEGKVLLGKRGNGCRNEVGLWDFPGGGVDFNEKSETAIKREALEEFGVKIEVLERFKIVDHIIRAEGQHWISITFIARLLSGEAQNLEPKKCVEYGWFKLDEIDPETLTISSKDNLSSYIKEYGCNPPRS